MKGLFVTDKDEIVINLFVALTKDGRVIAESSRDELDLYQNVDKSSIETHEVVFKRPSFSDTVKISKDLFNTPDGIKLEINPWSIRFKRIAALIKRWSFVDADGEELEANEGNIELLHPQVANVLGTMLDEHIGIM